MKQEKSSNTVLHKSHYTDLDKKYGWLSVKNLEIFRTVTFLHSGSDLLQYRWNPELIAADTGLSTIDFWSYWYPLSVHSSHVMQFDFKRGIRIP